MRMDRVGLGCLSGNCFGSDAGCATSGVVVVAIKIAAEAAARQIFLIGTPEAFKASILPRLRRTWNPRCLSPSRLL